MTTPTLSRAIGNARHELKIRIAELDNKLEWFRDTYVGSSEQLDRADSLAVKAQELADLARQLATLAHGAAGRHHGEAARDGFDQALRQWSNAR